MIDSAFGPMCQLELDIHIRHQEFYMLVPLLNGLSKYGWTIQSTVTREREVRALSDALTGVKVESAVILSDANENSFEISGVPVEIRSMAEWLLGQ